MGENIKKARVPRKIKKQIPKGRYCYKILKPLKEGFGFHIKTCPLFFQNKVGYGDCRLIYKETGVLNGEDLEDEDKERYDVCLDDQCKSCNIKCEW